MYLNLENVFKVFPPRGGASEVTAVNDVTLNIQKGELVTLLGPSGCGKTTTLRLIGGFEVPTSGKIILDNEDITSLPTHNRGMSMVFQSYAIFPHLNVFENISYGLNVMKVSKDDIKKRVDKVISLVGLTGFETRAPNQLSGGQQQRVALARALVLEPKVLLLDEPLSNLDAKLREQMRTEIRRIQQTLGITSIYVTHDQIEAMTLSDQVVVMNKGVIEQIGPPQEIYKYPNSRFVANFIGRANFVKAEVVESNSTRASVKCLGTGFDINIKEKLETGSTITLILRPELLSIAAGKGNLKGTVKKSLYLGNAVEYDIEAGNQLLTFSETHPDRMKIFESGEVIELELHNEILHYLNE